MFPSELRSAFMILSVSVYPICKSCASSLSKFRPPDELDFFSSAEAFLALEGPRLFREKLPLSLFSALLVGAGRSYPQIAHLSPPEFWNVHRLHSNAPTLFGLARPPFDSTRRFAIWRAGISVLRKLLRACCACCVSMTTWWRGFVQRFLAMAFERSSVVLSKLAWSRSKLAGRRLIFPRPPPGVS